MDKLVVGENHLANKMKRFTKTEWVVFRKLLELKTYGEIASELQVTIKTVKAHAMHIYQKLDVGGYNSGNTSKRLQFLRMCLDFQPKKGCPVLDDVQKMEDAG